MATIAICPLPELGHVLPTLQLAKALRRAGHRIVYITLEACRATIEREDFELAAICAVGLPAGALEGFRARARASRSRLVANALEGAWRAIAARALLLGDEIDRLAAIGVDLALCDHDWEEPALAFAALGTRTATFSTSLWGAYPSARLRDYLGELDVPPLTSSSHPGSRVDVALAWSAHAGGELLARILREGQHARAGDWMRVTRRRRALRDRTGGPVLVLCPRELDFPRRHARPGVEYCGPCIDVERAAPELDPARGEPLVLCAVGSQGHRVRGRFLQAIIDAARAHGWRLVIGAPEVPQLRVLARASVAIVHGGLGTVKECIWFGVPMLVLPGDFDQPGNAARVEYHGLGIARSRARITAPEIGTLVAQLVADRERRERLARWSARFQALQHANHHVTVIETALGTRP